MLRKALLATVNGELPPAQLHPRARKGDLASGEAHLAARKCSCRSMKARLAPPKRQVTEWKCAVGD
jgi:hypothetical protein